MVSIAISVISDEFSENFEKVAQYLESQNIHYVELRGVWKSNILTMVPEEREKLHSLLDQYHLKVSSISGGLLKRLPPSLSKHPTQIAEENDALIDHAIELAKEFQAPYIRCFGFHGKFKIAPITQWDSMAVYQEWRSKIEEMKQKASAANISFICENEGGLNRSFEQMEKIGQDLCSPGFGLLYDMANVANRFGKNGVLNAEWLARLTKYILYIHAKGCYQGLFNRHTIIINGEKDICNWPEVIRYLKAMEPESWAFSNSNPLFISIETHMGPKDRWANSVKSLQNLLQLIR